MCLAGELVEGFEEFDSESIKAGVFGFNDGIEVEGDVHDVLFPGLGLCDEPVMLSISGALSGV